MKKSVVAAVAASNLTVFLGLVNASEQGSSGDQPCEMVKVSGPQGVCKVWDDSDWYPASSGYAIWGCVVYCDPPNNESGQGGGTFLVRCDSQHRPLNDRWYGGSTGCAGPTSGHLDP
jgi:hypothetical protein